MEVLQRRRSWVVLTSLAIFVATLVVALRLPNVYRSQTVILVDPQKVPDSYVPSPVSTNVVDRLSTLQQQVMSPTRLKKVIDSLGLYPELRGKMNEQDIIKLMQKSTSIELVASGDRRLSAFKIGFTSKNPVEAAQVANQLASMFIEENLKAREQQFTGTAEFLENELQSTKQQLVQKEQELGRIRSEYVLDLPESRQYHVEALAGLRTQLQGSQERVDRDKQDKVYLQSLMISTAPTVDLDAAAATGNASPLESQIQRLQARLSELRMRYGPDFPEVRKVQTDLEALRVKAARDQKNAPVVEPATAPAVRVPRNPVLQAEIEKLDRDIAEQTKLQNDLQQQINFHVSKLEQVPIFEEKISGLMRDYDTLRAHYNTLLDRKLSADMASALESWQKGERFVILDPAPIPQDPYGPPRVLISLAGLLGGLLGGFALAVIAEIADESVRSEREASRILGKPVLAGIPCILSKRTRVWRKLRAVGAVLATGCCSAALGLVISYFGGRIL